MADKSFGVKELNLLNASGTPTVTSPNNLNLNANTVAISTSATVGNNLTVTSTTTSANVNVTGIATVVNFNATGISTIAVPSNTNANSALLVTANGSSAYRFTGPGQDGSDDNPNIYLVRGQRYIFTNNSGGSHPFQIRVANGGAAYSTGVTNNGASSGNIIFNVQHDAPAQLYYQCTNHGGMVGNIYVVGGPQVISGVITATSFSGSGANLTNINSTSATGDFSIADKIIHTGDTNTAIRFPAVDTVTAETGGSERVRIDSSGRVIIGHNASVAGDGSSEFSFQIIGTTYVTSGLNQQRYANDVSGPSIILSKSRATSVGTHTIVQNGDQLGKIRFYGSDGNDFNNYGAEIAGHVDGTPGSNDMPGRLLFKTTADGAASPTERLRIDSTGRMTQNGTTSIDTGSALTLKNGYPSNDHTILEIMSDPNQLSMIYMGASDDRYQGQIRYKDNDHYMSFWTDQAERMRINSSGNLQIGCTAEPQNGTDGVEIRPSGSIRMGVDDTGGNNLFEFNNPNGNVGKIVCSGSNTSYQTSSDYRLKENVVAISDGITRLKTLKPSRFNFKADAKTTFDGFLAHEVSSIVPEAISGTKDEVDSDNNPVYQGIDQSKLVPLLTAALQEAITKIETLEAKVAALEGS